MPDLAKVIKGIEHCLMPLLEGCKGCPYYNSDLCLGTDLVLKDALELLKAQETIIRCKDCKYNSGKCNGLYLQFVTCYKTGSPHKEDWYCADGERG